jgi:hypothetical protein
VLRRVMPQTSDRMPCVPVARFSRAFVCCGNGIVLGRTKPDQDSKMLLEQVKARAQGAGPGIIVIKK